MPIWISFQSFRINNLSILRQRLPVIPISTIFKRLHMESNRCNLMAFHIILRLSKIWCCTYYGHINVRRLPTQSKWSILASIKPIHYCIFKIIHVFKSFRTIDCTRKAHISGTSAVSIAENIFN